MEGGGSNSPVAFEPMLTTQDSLSTRKAHEYCICCIRADSDTEELTFLKQTSRCVLSRLDFLLSQSCRHELEPLWKNVMSNWIWASNPNEAYYKQWKTNWRQRKNHKPRAAPLKSGNCHPLPECLAAVIVLLPFLLYVVLDVNALNSTKSVVVVCILSLATCCFFLSPFPINLVIMGSSAKCLSSCESTAQNSNFHSTSTMTFYSHWKLVSGACERQAARVTPSKKKEPF